MGYASTSPPPRFFMDSKAAANAAPPTPCRRYFLWTTKQVIRHSFREVFCGASPRYLREWSIRGSPRECRTGTNLPARHPHTPKLRARSAPQPIPSFPSGPLRPFQPWYAAAEVRPSPSPGENACTSKNPSRRLERKASRNRARSSWTALWWCIADRLAVSLRVLRGLAFRVSSRPADTCRIGSRHSCRRK
jgi:hypothetical protein